MMLARKKSASYGESKTTRKAPAASNSLRSKLASYKKRTASRSSSRSSSPPESRPRSGRLVNAAKKGRIVKRSGGYARRAGVRSRASSKSSESSASESDLKSNLSTPYSTYSAYDARHGAYHDESHHYTDGACGACDARRRGTDSAYSIPHDESNHYTDSGYIDSRDRYIDSTYSDRQRSKPIEAEVKLPMFRCDKKVHAKWPKCPRCLSIPISKCAHCQHPIEKMKALVTASHRKRFWIRVERSKPSLLTTPPGGLGLEEKPPTVTHLIPQPPPKELFNGIDITVETESWDCLTRTLPSCYECLRNGTWTNLSWNKSDGLHIQQCNDFACSLRLHPAWVSDELPHPQWWPCLWSNTKQRQEQNAKAVIQLHDLLSWPKEICAIASQYALPAEFTAK